MRTYRPTSHESAMDHASRSSLWTGSLARNGFLFFVQTVRKVITGRLKASWRGVCEGARRSGKSIVRVVAWGETAANKIWRDELCVVRGRVTWRRRSGALQG